MTKSQGNWQEIPALDIARSHPAVCGLGGKIYVFGGGGPDFLSLDDTSIYDPATGRWSKGAPMPTRRSGTACFSIGELIYVIGGGYKKPDGNFQFLKTVEIYNPATDSWSTGPDMQQPHDYPAATLFQGRIYILGGHHPDACLGGPKTDPGFAFCEHWAPGEDHWQQCADMPTPRFAAAAINDGVKIYACGGVAFTPEGFNNFDFFEIYDPQGDQWRIDEQFKLPWVAAGHGLCRHDEEIFFFGGYSTDNIHPRAAVYEDGQWQRLPDMPLSRAAMGVVVLGKDIYLIGGWADDGRTPINSVVVYKLP